MGTDSFVGVVGEEPVARLRPWDDLPRLASDGRLLDLARAMEADPEMLWARPLLALPDGTVFCGVQRLRAALLNGWETVPTLTVDLSPDRVAAWAIRDNTHFGEWDEPALAELLRELAAEGVDLALTGFTGQDLDRILAGLEPPPDVDEAPPLPMGEPNSRLGEIYELGPHRLLCGDARDSDALAALFAGERAGLLLCDPPYGVSYEGKTKRALRIQNDDEAGLGSLLESSFAAANAHLVPNASFYVFSPAGPLGLQFRLAIQTVGWQLHQSLVWEKNAIVLGRSDYHYQHEDILYGWRSGPGRAGRGRHQGSRWFGDNKQASVLHVDRPARSEVHPTQKPTELLARLMRNSSRRGEIVLDMFAGSGSTLVAADQLGRRCFAVELDPAYVDVIRSRYEGLSDGRA